MNISEKAAEFFQSLADFHPMYPDTPSEVIDQFIMEWETREHIEPEYRTFNNP